jgi:hypothetical protein
MAMAVKPPSLVVTLISAVPGHTPVTRPRWLTVALAALELCHVREGLTAVSGRTVAESW